MGSHLRLHARDRENKLDRVRKFRQLLQALFIFTNGIQQKCRVFCMGQDYTALGIIQRIENRFFHIREVLDLANDFSLPCRIGLKLGIEILLALGLGVSRFRLLPVGNDLAFLPCIQLTLEQVSIVIAAFKRRLRSQLRRLFSRLGLCQLLLENADFLGLFPVLLSDVP